MNQQVAVNFTINSKNNYICMYTLYNNHHFDMGQFTVAPISANKGLKSIKNSRDCILSSSVTVAMVTPRNSRCFPEGGWFL